MLLIVMAATIAVVAAVRGVWSPCGLSMISALNPMAERGRAHRYWLTVTWFVVGSVIGGAVLGAGCAALAIIVAVAAPPPSAVFGCAAVVATLAWLSDSPITRWRLPVHARQVDDRWIGRYRRWVYATGFGAQIGSGLATYIMSATVYLAVALAVLTGSPGAAVAIGTGFGLVRGLGILAGARAVRPERLAAIHRRLARWDAASLRCCAFACALVAAGCVGEVAGTASGVVLLAIVVGLTGMSATTVRARRGWRGAVITREHR